MKILYITAFYPPDNVIAAVRSGKLCKYFSREGNEIYVTTFREADDYKKNMYIDEKGIKRITFNEKTKKIYEKMITKRIYKDAWLKNFFLIFIRRLKNIIEMINITVNASKGIRKVINNEKPDFIIATYRPHFIIWLGLYGKIISKRTKLVIDIRDSVTKSVWNNDSKIDFFLQSIYIKFSDLIVTVTPWIKKEFCDSVKQSIRDKVHKKTFVITNGYDPEEWDEIKNIELLSDKDEKIHILAMGTFHNMSDASAFLIAVKELIENGEIPKNKFVLHYAGNDFKEYERQASIYGISDLLLNHGNLNRKEILTLERQCNILLLLSWNFKNDQDMYTGKLFEYMFIKRPILALVKGDYPNSGVKRIINECGIGHCFEYISKSSYEINNFIKKIHKDSINKNKSYSSNIFEIDKYSYKNLADKYLNLLKTNLK